MEDTGPLFNVRMQLGQGYNSSVQECRMSNAVNIQFESQPPSPDKDAVAKVDAESSTTSDKLKHTMLESISKDRISDTDLMTLYLEYMTTKATPAKEGHKDPDLPYRLNPDAAAQGNQNVIFSSRQVDSTSDINEVLGISSSAAIKAGSIGVGGEVGGSLATEKELKASDVTFFVSVRVINEPEEKKTKMTFHDVEGLRDMLLKIEDDDERARHFCRLYGDTFISDFIVGGELYALIRIKLRNMSKLKDVRAYASVQLTPPSSPVTFGAKTDAHYEGRKALEESEMHIRVQWRGGGEIKTHNYGWNLDRLVAIANAFPSLVSVKSAKIRAVLSPYTSLSDFQKWVHKGTIEETNKLRNLTFTYDRCSIYMDTLHSDFNAYSKLCTDIDDMISNSEGYIARTTNEGSGRKDEGNEVKSRGNSILDNTNDDNGSTRMETMIRKLKDIGNIELENEDLSNVKYLCRVAMLFIQQEAMDIVDNPRKVDNQEYFGKMPRDYICPANIAQRLPKKKENSEVNGFPTSDLSPAWPRQIRENPYFYYSYSHGNNLMDRKSYTYFQIGNFNGSDFRMPSSLSIHLIPRPWWKVGGREAACHQDDFVSGIEMIYTEDDGFSTKRQFVGRKGMKKVESIKKKDGLDISRVKVWHEDTSSHRWIRYLQVYHHNELTLDDRDGRLLSYNIAEANKTKKSVASLPEEQWGDRYNWSWTRAPLDTPGYWQFAGFFGAFEKCGRFELDRCLARIAVVFKRMDD